jgi:hypothetical protein
MTAAGWYPDPSGQGQRYFDGQRWTEHLVPPPPSRAERITVTGPNHALHALISLFTCGLWLPIWMIIAILDSKKVKVERY